MVITMGSRRAFSYRVLPLFAILLGSATGFRHTLQSTHSQGSHVRGEHDNVSQNNLKPDGAREGGAEAKGVDGSREFPADAKPVLYQPVPFDEEYNHAKYRNFHKIRERVSRFWQHVKEDEFVASMVCLALGILLVGPCVVYLIVWTIFMKASANVREHFPFLDQIAQSMKGFVFVLSLITVADVAIRCVDFQAHRWIQVDLEHCLKKFSIVCVGYSLSKVASVCHHHVEIALLKHLDKDFQARQEFMAKVSNPTHVEPLPQKGHTQEQVIFSLVWMPFYLLTVGTIWSGVLLMVLGFNLQLYFLGAAYGIFTLFSSIVGARTLGPDIYGGITILLEKPFEVGDIISVEKCGGAGGCQQALVTGFVERVSLRSTIIRRFDMRPCTVPNSWLAREMIANWKRPRKLIFIEFGVSHRTPVSLVNYFSDKLREIVKNHPDIDQQLYTKAVCRSLRAGYEFRIVCFNSHGTKKQFVQQDLVFRISSLARELGIKLTFQETSVSVEREEAECHYLEEDPQQIGVDLSAIVPSKNKAIIEPKVAPDNYILIRLEEAFGLHNLVRVGSMATFGFRSASKLRVYGKVTHGLGGDIPRSKQTGHQIVDPNRKTVKWLTTLSFRFDPSNGPIDSLAKLQLFLQGRRFWHSEELLAEAVVNIEELVSQNAEVTQVALRIADTAAAAGLKRESVALGVRVFKAPNIEFASPGDDTRRSMEDDAQDSSYISEEILKSLKAASVCGCAGSEAARHV